MQYSYRYRKRVLSKIFSFYKNVTIKYKYAYSLDDMDRNIYDAFIGIYDIEKILPRREPTIQRWSGYYMANCGKWYFAYTMEGNTITVVDACHAQNMHD